MQPKSPENRTYSFHFNRLLPTHNLNNLFLSKETANAPNTPKNVNINFRYQSQAQQFETNILPKKQLIKPTLIKEKSSQQMKRYTFSLLHHQNQQAKIPPNQQQLIGNLTEKKSNQFGIEIEKEKQIKSNQQNYSFKVASKNNANNSPVDRLNTSEAIRQKQTRVIIESQLKNQREQNNALKIQIKEFENQLLQKDRQIQQINCQLDQLKRMAKENESNNILNSAKSKAKDSAISTLQIEESEHSFEKQVKEWSNSTIIYNYEQEYKQVLAIFEVQLNQQNYHDHLLSQIDRLLKKVEQANKCIALSKQRQKQIYRLTSHIKKVQGQNIHLANLIPFLHKQIGKSNDLLQQANREIEVFNIKMLNNKYHQSVLLVNDAS